MPSFFFARAISARFLLFCAVSARCVLYSARGHGMWFGTAFTPSLFHVFDVRCRLVYFCARDILILQQ